MPYSTLLLDLDHTLLDSHGSEIAAFDQALGRFGVETPGSYLGTYRSINGALWASVERNELTPREVQETRFRRLVEAAGLDIDPDAVAAEYVIGLGANGELYPGARRALEDLVEVATLALVTNGLREVQRSRIERLGLTDFFDVVVISDEVGESKPGTAIFDITFSLLGSPTKQSTLMIGDSLSSDIRGGSNYGIATCWYNPNGKQAGPTDVISHEIVELAELPALVRSIA